MQPFLFYSSLRRASPSAARLRLRSRSRLGACWCRLRSCMQRRCRNGRRNVMHFTAALYANLDIAAFQLELCDVFLDEEFDEFPQLFKVRVVAVNFKVRSVPCALA